MTDAVLLPPGLIVILSGLLLLRVPERHRLIFLLGAPLLTLAYTWALASQAALILEGPFAGTEALVSTGRWLGLELFPVRVDALGLIFATVFCIMAAAGGLFALSLPDARELAALQVYAGSAIGAVLAGDLVTLFVFWELMAIASTLVIWAGGEDARGPGLRYAAIHFLGGALLMAGAAGYVATTGETAFLALPSEGLIAALVLLAFLVNSGAWPLNAWLPDAYPRASWAGTVFLSAFTTKTAVYALIRGFPGEEWVLWLGLATLLYGCVYALIETEIRRLLCFAIIVQSGFLLTGIGMGTRLGLNGAAGHAFLSILYSGLLFMVAGAVIQATGRRRLGELGGLWRRMPITGVMAVIGGLAIAAMPGMGSYVSKALITSAAGYGEMFYVWLALTAAGAGVAMHGAVRLQWGVFGGADRGGPAEDPPLPMLAAMVALAAVIVAIALFWEGFYALLPLPEPYKPYKAETVIAQIQLLAGAALVYLLALRLLPERRGITLDTDWLYRGAGAFLLRVVGEGALDAYSRSVRRWWRSYDRVVAGLYRTHGPEGALAKSRPSGYVALWMTALLCLLLIFITI